MGADQDLRRWAATWGAAGRALDARRREELQAMGAESARAAAEDLASVAALLPAKDDRGLVEQQRRFRRLDR